MDVGEWGKSSPDECMDNFASRTGFESFLSWRAKSRASIGDSERMPVKMVALNYEILYGATGNVL
jgi:hypothetical protein